MKILKWLVILILLFGIAGLLLFLMAGKYREMSGEHPLEFIHDSVPESVRSLPNVKITGNDSAILQEAATIDGFPCVAGEVRFSESGQLFSCTLAEDTVIQGNLIPRNTKVELREDFSLGNAGFPEDTEIQGYPILSGNAASGIVVTAGFYRSGRLSGFLSPANVEIQGIPCRKTRLGLLTRTPFGLGSAVNLYENGNLRGCRLSKDAEIDGRLIPAGRKIEISEDGKVTIRNVTVRDRLSLWTAGIFDY